MASPTPPDPDSVRRARPAAGDLEFRSANRLIADGSPIAPSPARAQPTHDGEAGSQRFVLPYPARPGQMRLASSAHRAFTRGGHAVLEAGTGTGKTVAILAAVLAASRRDGRRIVWLTRTNAQARQVIVELRAIRDHPAAREAAGGDVLAVALQGRHHLCPKLRDDARYAGADSQEYARLCAKLKRDTPREQAHPAWPGPEADPEHEPGQDPGQEPGQEPGQGPGPVGGRPSRRSGGLPMASQGCAFYGRLLQNDPHELAARLAREPLDAHELARLLEARGVCPYEAVKGLLAEARLVVAPYVYLADPGLAKAMTEWMDTSLSECILVVDEAHNLPEYLREVYSASLGQQTIERALDEAKAIGDPELAPGVSAGRFVRLVDQAVQQIVQQRLGLDDEDALLERDDFTVPLLAGLKMASPGLLSVVAALSQEGQRVRERALQAGRLPRSYLGAMAGFLGAWLHHSPGEHVPLVEKGLPPRLALYCLDPALGAVFLRHAHASVHISGTLRPLEAHRDLLGLPREAHCESLPSPYSKKNLRLVLVDDVTTRFDERNRDGAMMDSLVAHVESFARVKGLNAMVLFPSHALLDEMKGFVLTGPDRRVFVEESGLAQNALHERLDAFRQAGLRCGDGDRAGDGALWCGVTGGRVSEGMDFPGSTLQALCLVGVPYPRPSARQEALLRFNDIRFGRGWEYTVEAPTLRRVMQAVGRVIRDEADRGIVFLLDHRYRKWGHEFERLERLGDEEEIADVLGRWRLEQTPPAVA